MRIATQNTEWEEVWKFGVLTGWRRFCGDDDAIWFEFRGNPELVFTECIPLGVYDPKATEGRQQ